MRILQFLSLVNKDSKLSITNLAILFMLTRFVLVPQLGIHDSVIFLSLVANYCHRRYEDSKLEKATEVEGQVANLRREHLTIREKLNSFENISATLIKQSEDVKKLISENNLSRAFNPRNKML